MNGIVEGYHEEDSELGFATLPYHRAQPRQRVKFCSAMRDQLDSGILIEVHDIRKVTDPMGLSRQIIDTEKLPEAFSGQNHLM